MKQHTAQQFPRSGRARRRFAALLLAIPVALAGVAAPAVAPSAVRGDELADARAEQAALLRRIAEQQALVRRLDASQASLRTRIGSTAEQLAGITEDLTATRQRVESLTAEIAVVQAGYDELVAELADLDARLVEIEGREAAKKAELGRRKAELTRRIREAWEAERTSLLETFLSGASFTDLLAEMSAQLDAAAQDEALARAVAADRATLLALHQTVRSTRTQTNELRQAAAVQRAQLERARAELVAARDRLDALEDAVRATLAAQRSQYDRLAADEAALRRAIADAEAARVRLQRRIQQLIAEQYRDGRIPSRYNGTFVWPMQGTISQDYGCTTFPYYPPRGSCPHWHTGIDIVAPYGTPVRAAGPGRVVYVGWNWPDGNDPAFVVVIAHASNLSTWYAHLQPRYPVRAGELVRQGQVIGYEGNTGRSTGPHLHWVVMLNGTDANPRLFL